LRLTRAILARMEAVTSAAGARLLVVVIPSLRPMPAVAVALTEWAPDVGYAVLDLRDRLAAAERTYGRPMYTRFYLTTLGDLVLATAVRERLVELGWVAAPSDATLARRDQRVSELVASPTTP